MTRRRGVWSADWEVKKGASRGPAPTPRTQKKASTRPLSKARLGTIKDPPPSLPGEWPQGCRLGDCLVFPHVRAASLGTRAYSHLAAKNPGLQHTDNNWAQLHLS